MKRKALTSIGVTFVLAVTLPALGEVNSSDSADLAERMVGGRIGACSLLALSRHCPRG